MSSGSRTYRVRRPNWERGDTRVLMVIRVVVGAVGQRKESLVNCSTAWRYDLDMNVWPVLLRRGPHLHCVLRFSSNALNACA